MQRVAGYYSGRLAEHGTTHRGVDWNSTESQELRFDRLLHGVPRDDAASFLDWGCGYGAMAGWLAGEVPGCRYVGYDVSAPMVEAAREANANAGAGAVRFTDQRGELEVEDHVLASGIFNVKLETPAADWHAYVLETIDALAAHARVGFAFNVLTSYSDADRMRDDLFYADPLELFHHCKRRYSRHVALLHDYGLYEFTICVRKEVA